MDKPRIINGNMWTTELLKALGLDASRNRRVIIDCEVGQPVRIYLENLADERLWDVRMPPLEIVEVVAKSDQANAVSIVDGRLLSRKERSV